MSAAPKSAALPALNVNNRLYGDSAAVPHFPNRTRFARACACACAHTQERLYKENAARCGTAALFDLAARVARLVPCHRNPEQFHMAKSEIVATLRRLAREAGHV
jgi:hypothetical protein